MLIICSPLSIGYLSLFTSHALVPNMEADRRALIHLRQQAGSLLTSRWLKQPRRGSALCSALWTYRTRVEVWLCLIFNKCTCVPFVSINLNLMSECDYFSTWGAVLCVCAHWNHITTADCSLCCFCCSGFASLCLLTADLLWCERAWLVQNPRSLPETGCCWPITWHVIQIVFSLTNEFRAHRTPFISGINSFALALLQ